MDSVSQIASQVGSGFNNLTLQKKIMVISVAVITFLTLSIFFFFANKKDYQVLYSNLSGEDAGLIIAKLKDKKLSYKISASGDSILAPSDQVAELRLELASEGLPQGGSIGFEIFDNKNFGVTEFVQQLNYQRALQGELTRTINSLDEIQSSRVHVVIPQKSLFVEETAKPTASVVVKMKQGRKLSEQQIEGIARFVASSVEGMNAREVMIVDNKGNILSRAEEATRTAKMTTAQIEYQRTIEKELASRVQSMLERVIGKDKVVTRVSADLDFRVMEKTEEFYDSEEPAVRSMQRRTERSKVPAVQGESSVDPVNGGENGSLGGGHERTDETINYEINRTISKIVMPVGEIKKLSVAVLVDGTYIENEKGVEEFQPRSKKEMAALEDVVKKSVGFDVDRGDQVVLSNIPFRKIETVEEFADEGFWKTNLPVVIAIVKYIVLLVALGLIVVFVLRPLVKYIATKEPEKHIPISPSRPLPQGLKGGGIEAPSASFSLPSIDSDEASQELEFVKYLASKDAKKFSDILRYWIK